MKPVNTVINKFANIKHLSYLAALLSVGALFDNSDKAQQIANSAIDLQDEVKSIKQEDFKNKGNLESQINDNFDKEEVKTKRISEKTIYLRKLISLEIKKFLPKNSIMFSIL